MGFEARGNNQQGSDDRKTVDYDALNKYVVETAGLQKEKTVVGVVSGIIDLGLQNQEDAKVEFNGTEEDERKEVAERPRTYFENDYDGKRVKRYPRPPVNAIAMTVDFPGIIIDKGQFFENSNPAPLRLCLNGNFWRKHLKIMDLGKLIPLTLRKNDKTHDKWSFMPNSLLYKMAVGAELIEAGEPFLPQDIIGLLGKPLLFKARVWFNGDFYNEKVSFAAGLVDGMTVPDYDENLLFDVGFMSENEEKAIRFLTNPMINRMKMSPEFATSEVKKQIEKIKGYTFDDVGIQGDDSTPDDVDSDDSGGTDPDFDPDSVPF